MSPNESALVTKSKAMEFVSNYRNVNGKGWNFPTVAELQKGLKENLIVVDHEYEWAYDTDGSLIRLNMKTGKIDKSPTRKALAGVRLVYRPEP